MWIDRLHEDRRLMTETTLTLATLPSLSLLRATDLKLAKPSTANAVIQVDHKKEKIKKEANHKPIQMATSACHSLFIIFIIS